MPKRIKDLMKEYEDSVATLNVTFRPNDMEVTVEKCNGGELIMLMTHLITVMSEKSEFSVTEILADLTMNVIMDEGNEDD